MLKTITKSSNKKLGGCAATYRSGSSNVYDTCPSTCSLKPVTPEAVGSVKINPLYLEALIQAVPKEGVAWTYTHFPKELIPITSKEHTCINISTDSPEEAVASHQSGHPTVVVRPSTETNKVDVFNCVRFVRCPAEYQDLVTCNNCGGDTPLCARHDRDYVIKFTAHGAQAKSINVRMESKGETNTYATLPAGGCYGNGGPVRLQWEKTKGPTDKDHIQLAKFVEELPAGTKLRHHVVGDLG